MFCAYVLTHIYVGVCVCVETRGQAGVSSSITSSPYFSLLKIFVCMTCLWMWRSIYVCNCGCLHVKDTCEGQKTGSDVCSFHPFETFSLFPWIVTGQLAHELPGYLALRALTGLQMRVTVTSFYMSSRESNSGPYHCMTSHFTHGADTSAMSLLYI